MDRFTLRAAVYLIPIKGSKVLLSRRFNTGWMDGKYSLVCGHLDGNEPISSAMIREAFEEAKIKVNKKDLIPITVLHRNIEPFEYVDFFYLVRKWKGKPKIGEPDQCDDLAWFDINKLPKNILPYVKDVVLNIKSTKPFTESGWKK